MYIIVQYDYTLFSANFLLVLTTIKRSDIIIPIIYVGLIRIEFCKFFSHKNYM